MRRNLDSVRRDPVSFQVWNGFAVNVTQCWKKRIPPTGVPPVAERCWSGSPSQLSIRKARRRWIIAVSCCRGVMHLGELLLRSSFHAAASQALVSSPTASASFACCSSKVQKRSALSSSAQATCSESSVRTPSVGPCRRARSMLVSQTLSGKLTGIQTPCAQSC